MGIGLFLGGCAALVVLLLALNTLLERGRTATQHRAAADDVARTARAGTGTGGDGTC